MRIEVIEKLTAPGGGEPLRVASVARQWGDKVVEGAALSPERGLYPIQDGILNLLPRGPGALSPAQGSNLLALVARGYEWPWRLNSLSLLSRQPLGPLRERAIFREMLGEPQGGLWLDLAASTALYGRWLAPLVAAQGGEVLALDFAWPMLRAAQAKTRHEGHPNLSFVRARAEQLPFASGTLAGVVCGGSLNEFGSQGAPRVLREVARALQADGVALFMHLLRAEPGAGRWAQTYLAEPGGVAFWDREQSNRLFEAAGLSVEAEQAFGVVAFTRVRRG